MTIANSEFKNELYHGLENNSLPGILGVRLVNIRLLLDKKQDTDTLTGLQHPKSCFVPIP